MSVPAAQPITSTNKVQEGMGIEIIDISVKAFITCVTHAKARIGPEPMPRGWGRSRFLSTLSPLLRWSR
jgi:hypothetical protein